DPSRGRRAVRRHAGEPALRQPDRGRLRRRLRAGLPRRGSLGSPSRLLQHRRAPATPARLHRGGARGRGPLRGRQGRRPLRAGGGLRTGPPRVGARDRLRPHAHRARPAPGGAAAPRHAARPQLSL
ncbi:MAG: hypothetical protein AVDCRST_MAG47-317, partial [uncultured Nocardioidaceae bacterium]